MNEVAWQETRYPDLVDLGTAQHWVFTRAQLAERGWTSSDVRHELRMNRWRIVAPQVVMAGNTEATLMQRRWCGQLHAGGGSAVTHLTACLDAGLAWATNDLRIHVITRKGDVPEPLDGFCFHQTRRPFWRWIERVPGHPPRIEIHRATLLTAERDRSIRRAIGLLAAGVQQGVTEVGRLQLGIKEIRKLRHGKQFGLALGDIAGGAQSFAEIDVVRLCRDAGLMPPTRQARRRDKDGRWRYLDLEWVLPDGRTVALEVDGSFHMKAENWSADKRRERAVVISGTTVLRCTSVELRYSPYDVITDLIAIGIPRQGPESDVA